MYKIKDTVYSDAGKMIKNDHFAGYSSKGNIEDFIEFPIDISAFRKENNLVYCGDIFMCLYDPKKTYADYKKSIIKGRYSNDDQIAIMLNKDESPEDLDRYEKMQAWRNWASTLANLIVNYKKNGV